MQADPAILADLLGELVDEVRALRRIVEGNAPSEPIGPVFVADAAELLGCSRSHLDRVIRALPEEQRPAILPTATSTPGARPRRRYYWPDADALRAWWVAASEPAPRPQRAPRRPKQTGEAVTNWRQLAAELNPHT